MRLTGAFLDLDRLRLYRGRPITPEQATIHVSAMRDGVTLQWLLAPDEVDLVAAVRWQIALYADIPL